MNSEYQKLGGWLLVFLLLSAIGVVFTFPSLLTLLGFIIRAPRLFANMTFMLLFLFSFLMFLLEVYKIFLIPQRRRESYDRIITIQIVELIISTISLILSMSLSLEILIQGVLLSIVWLMYLKASLRARAFYQLDA